MDQSPTEPVLQVSGLSVTLKNGRQSLPVLDGLSFAIQPGRTLALIGESGCGKSMAALAVIGLLPDGLHRTAGSIRLAGEELTRATPGRLRALRGSTVAMVFQEPMTALNPVLPVGEQIAESLRLHGGLGRSAARRAAVELLRDVDIADPQRRAGSFPHELSGGMRQRVVIAIAIACRPKLLIADEPTTALDVTVQAQIFDLLQSLQRETGAAILLISHDLHAVAGIADEVCVLYAGSCAETGPADAVLHAPTHPYTQGLLACTPRLQLGGAPPPALAEIPGMVPPLGQRGPGCSFAARCPRSGPDCAAPPPFRRTSPAHEAACWRVPDLAA